MTDTMSARVKRLGKLLDKVVPIPDDWVPGGGGLKSSNHAKTPGSVEMECLPCESWGELVTACRTAMKWTEGLDRGLSVCLAAILGTGSVGSQLWIRLIAPASCLDGDTPIVDPVDGSILTVKERHELGKPFHVWTLGGSNEIMVRKAMPPECKGPASMFEVKTVGRKTICVTEGHRFWTGEGYESLKNLRKTTNEINGDRIESVTYLGERPYYDFHVPETNSYWACGFINHNSGKSTICEALSVNRRHVKALSTIRGFHSGYKEGDGSKNLSLVLKLKGKTLITKDADSMISSPNWPQIMGEARDLFDRTARTDYRTGMGLDHEAINMTWVLCGTSALRNSDMSELGARFVDCVLMEGIDEDLEREVNRRVAHRAFRNVSIRSNGKMETQLDPDMVRMMQLCGGYIDYLHDNAEELIFRVEVDEEVMDQVISMATFVAYMRARPSVRQTETTEREFSARLVEQFCRLTSCLTVVLSKTRVDGEVLRRVVRCAMDTARGRTLQVAKHLHEAGDDGLELSALAGYTNQGTNEELRLLRFLRKIGAVDLRTDKERAGRRAWHLTSRMARLYAEVTSFA